MGLYDRAYARSDGEYRPGQRPIAWILIGVCVVVWLVDSFVVVDGQHPIGDLLALRADWYQRPWQAYQFLTSGFVHASLGTSHGVMHILLNMYALYFFGRWLEPALDRREFLAFYLTAIVFGSVVWWVSIILTEDLTKVLPVGFGASGAVTAVMAATALRFPHDKILFFGAIPMSLWVAAAIMIGLDLMGAMGLGGTNIAYTAHLGGAAFGELHHVSGLRLTSWFPAGFGNPLRRRPRLKVVRGGTDDSLSEEGDRLLRKIHEQGQDSLTARERKTLERYSRMLNERRRGKNDGA